VVVSETTAAVDVSPQCMLTCGHCMNLLVLHLTCQTPVVLEHVGFAKNAVSDLAFSAYMQLFGHQAGIWLVKFLLQNLTRFCLTF